MRSLLAVVLFVCLWAFAAADARRSSMSLGDVTPILKQPIILAQGGYQNPDATEEKQDFLNIIKDEPESAGTKPPDPDDPVTLDQFFHVAGDEKNALPGAGAGAAGGAAGGGGSGSGNGPAGDEEEGEDRDKAKVVSDEIAVLEKLIADGEAISNVLPEKKSRLADLKKKLDAQRDAHAKEDAQKKLDDQLNLMRQLDEKINKLKSKLDELNESKTELQKEISANQAIVNGSAKPPASANGNDVLPGGSSGPADKAADQGAAAAKSGKFYRRR